MYMNFNNLHNRQQVLDRAHESFDDLVSNEDKWYPSSVTTFAAASVADCPLVKQNSPHLYLHFSPLRPYPKSITLQFYLSGITTNSNCHWAAALYNSTTLAYVTTIAYAEKSGGVSAAGLNNGVYNFCPKPDGPVGKIFVKACTTTGMVNFTVYMEPVMKHFNLTDFKLGIQSNKSYAAGSLNGTSYPAGNYTNWIRIRDLWLNF